MEIKAREIPYNIQMRRLLKPRMPFSEKELRQLATDEKGYEGECYFDGLILNSGASSLLQLNDLMLQWNDNVFQIDSLLFSPHKIYLSDIKNYEGEYYIEGDQWFFMSGTEVKNPVHQLQRCESLLRPLLRSIRINLPIEAQVVFVHPEFTLFQANKNLPIILPTQLNSFIGKLSSVSMKFNPTLIEAAKKLAALHVKDSPYYKRHIPNYSYETLKKGVACKSCRSLTVQLDGQKLICDLCGYTEDSSSGILRSVGEFKMLCPERLITVTNIMDWIRLNINRNRLARILKQNFEMVGKGKNVYYRQL